MAVIPTMLAEKDQEMRSDGNTVHKCIHEALDMSWCDCSDTVRQELNVTLPRPVIPTSYTVEELARMVVYLGNRIQWPTTLSEDTQDCIEWCQDLIATLGREYPDGI